MGLSVNDITGIGAVSDFAKTVVNKIWPDADAKQKQQAEQLILETTQEYNLQQGQMDINKEEAKSSSVFVAGWRPFIGWTCGFALLYAAILEPLARFMAVVLFKYLGSFPVIDTNITMQVLLGLLGLGGMRTFEKFKGVASK